MNAILITYFLCAIYVAQTYTGTYYYKDNRDRICEFLIAVFWLPTLFVIGLVWLMNYICKGDK